MIDSDNKKTGDYHHKLEIEYKTDPKANQLSSRIINVFKNHGQPLSQND